MERAGLNHNVRDEDEEEGLVNKRMDGGDRMSDEASGLHISPDRFCEDEFTGVWIKRKRWCVN